MAWNRQAGDKDECRRMVKPFFYIVFIEDNNKNDVEII